MATVSRNLLFMACFLALHVSSRCNLLVVDDREFAPSFTREREAEAGKAKKPEEMMESTNRNPPVRSSIGTNDKSRSLLDSVSMYIPRKRPLKREELPSLDSDYCQPQTHPPSHN